jgi:hypothetical protein
MELDASLADAARAQNDLEQIDGEISSIDCGERGSGMYGQDMAGMSARARAVMPVDGVAMEAASWVAPLWMAEAQRQRADWDIPDKDGVAVSTSPHACDQYTPRGSRACIKCGRGKAQHAAEAQRQTETQAIVQQPERDQAMFERAANQPPIRSGQLTGSLDVLRML